MALHTLHTTLFTCAVDAFVVGVYEEGEVGEEGFDCGGAGGRGRGGGEEEGVCAGHVG